MIPLGDLALTVVSDGEFRLDGGAMFGVVPRTLWGEVKPPDEKNRIRMGTNCLLVARGKDLFHVKAKCLDCHSAEKKKTKGGAQPTADRRATGSAAR